MHIDERSKKKFAKKKKLKILTPCQICQTGEEQLEANYQHNKYHIAEPLSDLAYYHYIARRTPIPILTKFVRPNYQVNSIPGKFRFRNCFFLDSFLKNVKNVKSQTNTPFQLNGCTIGPLTNASRNYLRIQIFSNQFTKICRI